MEDSGIKLDNSEVEFLKRKFATSDKDKAVEELITLIVEEGGNPYLIKDYIKKLMNSEFN